MKLAKCLLGLRIFLFNFGLISLGKTQKAEDIQKGTLFLFFQLHALIDFNAIKYIY